MANPAAKRITELDVAGPVSGAEQIAIVQNTRTVKATLDTIKGFTDTSCQCTLVSRYTEVGIPATTLISYIHTYTLPANTLNTDGSWLDITATGHFATNGNFKSAGVLFRQNGATVLNGGRTTVSAIYNDYYWNIELKVQRSSLATFTIASKVTILAHNGGSEVGNTPAMYTNYVVNALVNWGNDIQIVVTGDSSSATANDITCGQFIVTLNKLDANS